MAFQLEKKFQALFPDGDMIRAASMSDEDICIILTEKGNVFRFHVKTEETEHLFETNPPSYPSGFDIGAAASIYTMDDIVVLVNDFKTCGFVWNGQESYLLRLQREDYYACHSKYPIALFQRNGAPHLIFSTEWNHLQIANLTTRQVLTADKSLIEDGAEERHLQFCKEYGEGNRLFWPRKFDYFFGRLILSPDRRRFLSAGWVWGSQDCYMLFDVEDFLNNHRIKGTPIFQGEHLGRAACFLDDNTIAVLYKEDLDDWEWEEKASSSPSMPFRMPSWTIRLCPLPAQSSFSGNASNTDSLSPDGEPSCIALDEDWDLSTADLYYHSRHNCFFLFSDTIGLAAISMEGRTLYHNPEFITQKYEENTDCFLTYDANRLSAWHFLK